MRHENPARWPYIALVGAGLAAIPLAAAARRRRRDIDPDSAPGYTARRSFGEYQVVGRSVTIAKPRAELFAFWRDFQNLPRFMANLEKVEPSGSEPGHNTWHIRAANGTAYAVDTRIAREVDGELIAWRSTEDSDIDTEGRVTFEDAPGDRGTRVSLIIAYKPKGGVIGDTVAKLMRRSPELQARHDLKRFKMLMETGEIATGARTRADHQHQTEEAR
jgi:uncharacterized membrane protein